MGLHSLHNCSHIRTLLSSQPCVPSISGRTNRSDRRQTLQQNRRSCRVARASEDSSSAANGSGSGSSTSYTPEPQQEAGALQQQQGEDPYGVWGGNSSRPADWLASIPASNPDSPSQALSPEQFTRMREMAQRQRGAEIITVDNRYGDGTSASDVSEYKPKVATWGVFPRPQNISETYGGGRTIRPGQPLETESDKAKAERLALALKTYKRKRGIDVDPKQESEAQAVYDEGEELFNEGRLGAALKKFEEASGKMGLLSRLGGFARLKQAICLDSLGRSAEAAVIYKSLRSHSAAEVARQAKRMAFGFEAASTLRVTNDVPKNDFGEFFRPFTNDWSNTYVASAEESEEDKRQATIATIIAILVMTLPLLFVGILALAPRLHGDM